MFDKKITVFCGSRFGENPLYKETCVELAKLFVENNIGLVYGGGNVGLMGVIADEVLKLNGEVIGVIPKKLVDKEVAHHGLNELIIVDTMHERKAKMVEISDAFIALPGGIGTLEEIIEVLTLTQLGYHDKPCALLNIAGYYDKLIEFIDKMILDGFLPEDNKDLLVVEESPEKLIKKLKEKL